MTGECLAQTHELWHICEQHRDGNTTFTPLLVGEVQLVPTSAAAKVPVSWKRERFGRAWLDRINTCPYRECRTGCQRSRCHAGRGDDWGQTTLENCRSCLRNQGPNP